MRRRGDRVTITSGKYAGHHGTVENNVYQRTVSVPSEPVNGVSPSGHGEADVLRDAGPSFWSNTGPVP